MNLKSHYRPFPFLRSWIRLLENAIIQGVPGEKLIVSTILSKKSEIALSRKPFRIGHMYTYIFSLRMADTMTSQNTDLSSWDTLYNTGIPTCVMKKRATNHMRITETTHTTHSSEHKSPPAACARWGGSECSKHTAVTFYYLSLHTKPCKLQRRTPSMGSVYSLCTYRNWKHPTALGQEVNGNSSMAVSTGKTIIKSSEIIFMINTRLP
jgi:hypothetical protein